MSKVVLLLHQEPSDQKYVRRLQTFACSLAAIKNFPNNNMNKNPGTLKTPPILSV